MSQEKPGQKRFPSRTNSPSRPKQFRGNKPNKLRFKGNRNNNNKEKFQGESDALKGKVYFISSVKQVEN